MIFVIGLVFRLKTLLTPDASPKVHGEGDASHYRRPRRRLGGEGKVVRARDTTVASRTFELSRCIETTFCRDFEFFKQGEIGEAPVNVFKEKRYDGETWQVNEHPLSPHRK